MNRAQRRASPLRSIDREVNRRRLALRDEARRIRRSVPYPDESLSFSLSVVVETIDELEAAPSVVADLALEELRACRDDLARRVALN